MALPLYSFPGQKPGSNVFHGGDGLFYHLVNNRVNRQFAYLRCVHSESKKYHRCPGTAKASFEVGVLYHIRGHSHLSNVWEPYIRALKNDIFTRVKNGDQSSFAEIVQQEGQKYDIIFNNIFIHRQWGYPMQVRAEVGLGSIISRLGALRSALRPPVPRSLGVLGASLLLPEYQYLTKCPHVPDSIFAGMCGNVNDGTLSLVFISPEMKDFMQTRSMIFGDGTVRKLFRKPKASQIYSISAAWRFHVVVMARVIMQRRTQEAYEVMIDFLTELMPNFKPVSIKCDFEDAQINAWSTRFPMASIEGCLWHYDVAVYSMPKKKLGLHQLVKDEEEVASIVRAVGALPLLPTEDIVGGLQDLGWEAVEKGWMPQLKEFFRYMEREWVPKVPVLSVIDSVHRTNNVSESGNRALNKEIKVSNPSCFNVLRAFVATNEKYTVDLHTLASGQAPGRGRKISALRNDVVVKRVTSDYFNGDITRLQFLHRSSRRMQNVFNKIFK